MSPRTAVADEGPIKIGGTMPYTLSMSCLAFNSVLVGEGFGGGALNRTNFARDMVRHVRKF